MACVGGKGTWTGLHADVLRSYSWSANVAGAKHWQLLPPQHTQLLYDRFGRDLAPSFDTDCCAPGMPPVALADIPGRLRHSAHRH